MKPLTRRQERIADAILAGLLVIGGTALALSYFDVLWRN